ncbi:MAG: hypothetical protein ABIY70_08560 [Capsulimonas sp.]|uniref:hypothetical protein n=1 Tax=Capsulimonas sp. TaxID=2494211 RepID=UPI003265F7E6
MTGKLSPKAFWGICIAVVAAVVAVVAIFIRSSDPASQGPIAYKKYDMGAHMQEMRGKEAAGR